MTDYTLILEDSERYRTEIPLSYETFMDSIMMNWSLVENKHYTYHIVVTNVMGSSTSSLRRISKYGNNFSYCILLPFDLLS